MPTGCRSVYLRLVNYAHPRNVGYSLPTCL
jgi:hypothetical protein